MSEHGTGKTFGEQLERAKHRINNYAMICPQLTGLTRVVQIELQCGYNPAALVLCRLERDKFISEPDFNGHRRLL